MFVAWFFAVLLLIGLLVATAAVANLFARPMTSYGEPRGLTGIGVFLLLPAGILGIAQGYYSLGVTESVEPTSCILIGFTIISSGITYFVFTKKGHKVGKQRWRHEVRLGLVETYPPVLPRKDR